jgi:hypothetical protein
VKGFLPLFALMFGAILSVIGLTNLRGALQSRSWTPVRGVILSSGVTSAGTRDRVTSPEIRYEYDADGTMHRNDRIAYGMITSTRRARALRDRYRADDTVTVYVDTAHPERAVLRKGGVEVAAVESAAGLALLATWAVAAVLARKRSVAYDAPA